MNGFRLLVVVCFTLVSFTSVGFALDNVNNEAIVGDSGGVTLHSSKAIFDTSVTYTHKKILNCDPQIDATYKIVSSKEMEIIPKKSLKTNQSYSCDYKNNRFLFSTADFGLSDYNYFAKEKLLRLEFNDDIDIKTIISNIFLYKKKALAKTALLYDISSQSSKVLILKIKEVVDGDLELEILDGLSTIDGQKLNSSITKELGKVIKEPITLNSKKVDMSFNDLPQMVSKDDGSFAIRVFFSDTFYGNPIKKFISIDGIDNFYIKEDIYIPDDMRKKYNITDSYYYMDIMSKDFEPNSDYTLHIDKGLAHYQELKEDKEYKLHTSDRKKVVFFNDKEPYLSNLGEIGFSSINVDKATVIIDRITPENYRYFVGYSSANQEDASKFTQEIFAKDVVLDNPLNVVQKQKILLKDMVGDIPYGVYRVTIKYEDKNDKKVEDRSASKVVFVSDIGILANLSQNQAFVSLAKLSDTTPIVGAKVEIYSKNNILLSSTLSDENGIAIVDKQDLIDKEPKAIIVSTTNDKSFLLLDKSLNENSYEKLKAKEDRYSAFIYFQSNIIRPSSSINALITIKDREFISASKLPIKITLSQMYGKKIFQKVYTTDEFGLIDFTYTMSNEDKTGLYQLKATLGDKIIGQKNINVEAFMPPKIENKITVDKTEYKKSDFVNAKISSNYLFGMPSSFLSGKVNFTIRGVDYTNPKYKEYSFTNNTRDDSDEKVYINSEYDISLDEKGESEILLSCDTKTQIPSILKATIGATIMDDTQPVSTYKDITIYPYDTLVGVKLDNSSLEENAPLEGSVVLIDPITGDEIDRELSVVIKKVDWHYTYSDNQYKWEKESYPIDTFIVPSNQRFSKEFTQNGDFIIEVNDRLNNHSASTSFEVTGWGYTNITPSKDLKKIEINFEDRLYKKGDTLKASIKSPILEGRLLVSLEGAKVNWHKIIEIDKGVAQIEVPIEDELNRGAYLHAVAIRKSDTDASIIPFRVMGYKFIKPDRNEHKIDITMEYNATSPSNKSVPLKITTSKDTALLVSVVDSGILNITEQKPPKIFDFFNPMIDKKTLYFDIYDEVMAYLSEGNVISFGAGDDELMAERAKKHLPPANLDRVKPFMLWSNIIYTKDKKASVDLNIPEFNGKATIVVVAINKDSIGVNSDDIIIKDDIMIKPSYPRFILKGDKIEVPIRVFNTTKQTQNISLESNVSYNLSFELKDEESKNIELVPNSSKVIYANLSAKEEGKSSIVLSTNLNNNRFSNSVSLLVMTPYSLETKVYQDTKSSPTKIVIPDRFNHGNMIVSLSDNILGQLRGDLNYLISYPYGCAEQTSSKISAMFYSKPFLKNDKLTKEADNFIRQGIKKLSKMQNYYGEFAYWEQDGYVNTHASLYASETLLALDKGGYMLEDSVKKKIIKALKSIAEGNSLTTTISNENRVYAGYILSLYNELSSTTANLLYDKKIYENYYISWYYMSAIFKNLGDEKLAKEIYTGLRDIKLDELKNVNYPHLGFSSESRDMFLIFYLNTKHFYSSKNDFDIVKKQFKKLYSTHEKAMALRAISEYLGKAIEQDMSVELIHNNDKTTYTNSVAFSDGVWDSDIYINPLSGVVNYSIEVYKPLPKAIKNELVEYEVLSISREFIDINGDKVDLKNLEQGSQIYSKISILNNEDMENVVLNQRIPACMDIVNSRISKSKNRTFEDVNLHLDYKDIRDDRVLYFMNMPKPKEDKNKITLPNSTTIYTPLIVTTVGECLLPAVTIEAMYDSRISDYAKESDTIVVKSKKDIASKSISKENISSKKIEITDKYLKDKAREYYMLEASSTNPEDFIKYFNYPISRYFNKKSLSKDMMLDDKDNYNKEWRYKKYNIKDIQIIDKNLKQNIYRVKITFEYKLTNSRDDSIKGVSRHLITFREIKSKLLIDKIETF